VEKKGKMKEIEDALIRIKNIVKEVTEDILFFIHKNIR
tara:strand:+ start:478 stop:591 length:114 start_codon:yes stop_codon:yes gene_type:complete